MLPNFLCIGAAKSGTTWLYQNILQHPQVWMPPVKEIHYLNDFIRRPLVTDLFLRSRRRKRVRRRMGELFQQLKPNGETRSIGWYVRYLFLPPSDRWYASLFSPAKGEITGDVTPGYCRMSERRVARVHSFLPDAKIIYILRNPIHRDWSHAAMFFNRQGRRLAEVSRPDLEDFLNFRGTRRHSDYLTNLERWEKVYSPEGVFVGFFDHLARDPRGFFKSVTDYLELDSADRYMPEAIHVKRNAQSYPTIPDDIARLMARNNWETLIGLHQRFANEYTAGWIDQAHEILGDGVMHVR